MQSSADLSSTKENVEWIIDKVPMNRLMVVNDLQPITGKQTLPTSQLIPDLLSHHNQLEVRILRMPRGLPILMG
jgi:hypothetical protein